MSGKISGFYYIRSRMKIRVVVQGATQYFGQLRLVFYPAVTLPTILPLSSATFQDPNNVVNSAVLPHITIDPSKNDTYELTLPCPTATGYWSFGTAESNPGSYFMDAVQINPVRSGTAQAPTGTVGVQICVYAALEDPSPLGLTLNSLQMQESKPSDLFTKIAGVTQSLASVPSPFSAGLGLFSKVSSATANALSFFGYSKPHQEVIHAVALNRTCDNYSQCEGQSTAIVLGASQSQSYGIDPGLGLGKPEELSIEYLCSLPGLVAWDITATSASATETILYSWVVYPGLVQNSVGPNINPCPLAGTAYPFNFWAGDITFTIEFIASVFTRATFLIAWDPTGSSTAPSFQDALNSLKNVTVQVVGNTAIDLVIPYRQPFPVCKFDGFNSHSLSHVPGKTNGTVYVYVVNTVVDNGSTTPTVAMNVWMRSDNMALAIPTSARPSLDWLPANIAMHSEMVQSTPSEIFGQKSDLSKIVLTVACDRPPSIKHLTSRMCPVVVTSHTMGNGGNPWLIVQKANVPDYNDSAHSFLNNHADFLGYFSAAFQGARGTIKYSADFRYLATTVNNVPIIEMANHIYDPTTSVNYGINNIQSTSSVMFGTGAYALTQVNKGISARTDVDAPMIFGYNYLPTRAVLGASYDCVSFMCALANINNSTTDSVECNVLRGSGDDYSFLWFLGYPVGTY